MFINLTQISAKFISFGNIIYLMEANIGGFEMQVDAEPSSVVAVLGESFPYEQSWLEIMARQLADSLQLAADEDTPITFAIEDLDDSYFVGKRSFSASRANLKLSYVKELPGYNIDAENSESQAAVKEVAELLGVDESKAIALAAKYFRNGPFYETLALRSYYSEKQDEKKAELVVSTFAQLNDNQINLTLRVHVGVEYSRLAKFIAHLRAAETPMAEFFRKEFEKRIGDDEPPEDGSTMYLLEYMHPSLEEFAEEGYAEKLRDLILHVAEF